MVISHCNIRKWGWDQKLSLMKCIVLFRLEANIIFNNSNSIIFKHAVALNGYLGNLTHQRHDIMGEGGEEETEEKWQMYWILASWKSGPALAFAKPLALIHATKVTLTHMLPDHRHRLAHTHKCTVMTEQCVSSQARFPPTERAGLSPTTNTHLGINTHGLHDEKQTGHQFGANESKCKHTHRQTCTHIQTHTNTYTLCVFLAFELQLVTKRLWSASLNTDMRQICVEVYIWQVS